MANVDEARYQVLITGEGKVLVQARYAIRNNQRNFLKVTLPAGATLWTAFSGWSRGSARSISDGSLLLPLDKARSGEEAPEFAAEIVYLARGSAWNDKGQFKLSLPALDLPVSHTGFSFTIAAFQSDAGTGSVSNRRLHESFLGRSQSRSVLRGNQPWHHGTNWGGKHCGNWGHEGDDAVTASFA